jgi:hypothetical protein
VLIKIPLAAQVEMEQYQRLEQVAQVLLQAEVLGLQLQVREVLEARRELLVELAEQAHLLQPLAVELKLDLLEVRRVMLFQEIQMLHGFL